MFLNACTKIGYSTALEALQTSYTSDTSPGTIT